MRFDYAKEADQLQRIGVALSGLQQLGLPGRLLRAYDGGVEDGAFVLDSEMLAGLRTYMQREFGHYPDIMQHVLGGAVPIAELPTGGLVYQVNPLSEGCIQVKVTKQYATGAYQINAGQFANDHRVLGDMPGVTSVRCYARSGEVTEAVIPNTAVKPLQLGATCGRVEFRIDPNTLVWRHLMTAGMRSCVVRLDEPPSQQFRQAVVEVFNKERQMNQGEPKKPLLDYVSPSIFSPGRHEPPAMEKVWGSHHVQRVCDRLDTELLHAPTVQRWGAVVQPTSRMPETGCSVTDCMAYLHDTDLTRVAKIQHKTVFQTALDTNDPDGGYIYLRVANGGHSELYDALDNHVTSVFLDEIYGMWEMPVHMLQGGYHHSYAGPSWRSKDITVANAIDWSFKNQTLYIRLADTLLRHDSPLVRHVLDCSYRQYDMIKDITELKEIDPEGLLIAGRDAAYWAWIPGDDFPYPELMPTCLLLAGPNEILTAEVIRRAPQHFQLIPTRPLHTLTLDPACHYPGPNFCYPPRPLNVEPGRAVLPLIRVTPVGNYKVNRKLPRGFPKYAGPQQPTRTNLQDAIDIANDHIVRTAAWDRVAAADIVLLAHPATHPSGLLGRPVWEVPELWRTYCSFYRDCWHPDWALDDEAAEEDDDME